VVPLSRKGDRRAPRNLPVPAAEAADRTVAARIAPGIAISQMRAIDLIVCGSVAVNEHGASDDAAHWSPRSRGPARAADLP
jgi:hypothetical protein